uniref:Regulator of G protein signaling like 1 n=1 Tax=Accipiter nisus TaxID=211598 RepID=A0A8B9MQI3_9AVES
SPPVATIASTDMGLLLRDDVFVDFFNTFLNLPVFGQTPIYISSMGQWDLWPELPSHLEPGPVALLAWLEKHRLPHFCRSSLCLHLVLCQKLLGFIRSGEAAKLLNWQSADRWLLEKCISGSQGMWNFRAFIQGTAGEELTNFWLASERLLGFDESDARQRDLYMSLLHRLKATHLRQGSSVITLWGWDTITSFPISTRRDILSKMQERALFMIQSYWLPKFFIHCKKGMEEEKPCCPLLQEYQERLLRADSQEPSGFSENLFTMHIKRSQGLSGPYCSKKAKAEIWTLVKEGRDTQEMKMPSFQVQRERQPGPTRSTKESCPDKDALGLITQHSEHPANTAFRGKGGAASPKRPRCSAEQVLHLEDLCEEKVLSNLHSSAPLVHLPSLKKPVKTLSFLPWALSADTCAGRPFRDFLKCQDRPVETHLLDLWHDLEEFLPVVLDPSRENCFFLRHTIGKKICKTYLEEGAIQQLPLETRTLRSLRNHLMSGEFSPWIFRAQKEICKVLCSFYEEFLADDDKTFLQSMMQGHAVGKDECFLLSQRINKSLKLSQALHGTRNLEGLSSKHWRLIATRDLRKGGSIQAEVEPLLCRTDSQKMTTNVLAVQKPLLAVESPSKENELLCLKSPSPGKSTLLQVSLSHWRSKHRGPGYFPGHWWHRDHIPLCLLLYRHFMKVLHNPAHLQFFKQFLKERNADEPLRFWMAVERLVAETNPKMKSFLINRARSDCTSLPEEQLDCHTSIIKEINEAETVSPLMLMTAQIFVQKAMEKRCETKKYWKAKMMAGSQIPLPRLGSVWEPRLSSSQWEVQKGGLCLGASPITAASCAMCPQRWAWYAIRDVVKSICKFRREMGNDKCRAEFEDFLRRELGNEEESMARLLPPSLLPPQDNKEGVLVKRRLFNNQLITVNFLVDDLRFYLEIDKFSRLADSVEALAARNMQSEKEVAFLKRKVAIISKLFLNSDIPPKLNPGGDPALVSGTGSQDVTSISS